MENAIPQLTSDQLETILDEGKSALIVFSRGNDLRNDFSIAFKKAATEHDTVAFGKFNPDDNAEVADYFEISDKAVMVALYNGSVLSRRVRPWGTDVPLAIELLKKTLSQDAPPQEVDAHQEDSVEEVAVNNQQITQEEKQPVSNNTTVHVTDETFQAEVIDHELPVLVDFWAPWCGPCKMVGPILDKLAEEYAGRVRIAKVDTDQNPGLSQTFRIMSIPTIMLIKDQTIVFSQPGALPEPSLRELLDKLIELEVPSKEEQEAAAAAAAQEETAN